MYRIVLIVAALIAAMTAQPEQAFAQVEPRAVIVLHNADSASEAEAGRAVPALVHLGLTPELHTAYASLPDLSGRTDLRGLVIWLDRPDVADPEAFVAWVKSAAQSGIPIALMGATPDVEDRFGLFLALGLLFTVDERAYTYDLRAVEREPDIVDFERRFDNLFPDADIVRPLDPGLAEPLLILQRRGDMTDRTYPLLITARGGYAAPGYALWTSPDRASHRWYIDPVSFFRRAFRLDGVPAPDATTLNARRIFAPVIQPAYPSDEAALQAVMPAAAGAAGSTALIARNRALADDGATPIPPRSQVCTDRRRALLLGHEGLNAALDDGAALRRMTAFAPLFLVCNAERDLTPLAVRAVFEHARTLPLIPTPVSLDEINGNLPGVSMDRIAPMTWRIGQRGAVQTIRFDDAGRLRLDWNRSDGVLGAGRVNGSLYVSLDPDIAEPAAALTDAPWAPPPFASLVESSWSVSSLVRDPDRASMKVSGTGRGDMVWSVTPGSLWEVRLSQQGALIGRYRAMASGEGVIAFSLPAIGAEAAELELIRQPDLAGAP
jgi:hypothetical protein